MAKPKKFKKVVEWRNEDPSFQECFFYVFMVFMIISVIAIVLINPDFWWITIIILSVPLIIGIITQITLIKKEVLL